MGLASVSHFSATQQWEVGTDEGGIRIVSQFSWTSEQFFNCSFHVNPTTELVTSEHQK